MKQSLQRFAGLILHFTRLEYLPVRVRRGFPAGARWTLFPWTSYWRGGYEPDMERTINSLGNLDGKTCWDLGAHYGYYSIGLALRTGPRGQVVAAEPLPANYARLERHRRMNQLHWLKTFPCAVSDTPGEAEFFNSREEGDTTGHFAYEGEVKPDPASTLSVSRIRMDDLVESGSIRLPDFIKIDVEGHGHHALAGAMNSIRRNLPVIVMGFHSPQEVSGTEALLLPLGYRFTPAGREDPPNRIGADYLLRVG